MKLFTKILLTLAPFIALSTMNGFAGDEDSLFHDNSDMNWHFHVPWRAEMPTIEFQYGAGQPSLYKTDFNDKFSDINIFEGRIGYVDKKVRQGNSNLINFDFKYLFVGNYTSNMMPATKTAGKIRPDAWKFGFGNSDGDGFKFSEKSDLILYTTKSLVWTQLDFKDTSADAVSQNKMNVFGDNFRFGKSWESGLKYEIYAPVALNLSFERSEIYPRHIFWSWVGSGIIEEIGDGIIGMFTSQVRHVSPAWGTIVNFVFKSAYSYGFSELTKKQMNWPIKTTSPMLFDTYKIGLTFAF